MLIEMLKNTFYLTNMAPFDQIRLLHLKKYLLCALLILKRIQFAKQRKRIYRIQKIRSGRSQMLLNVGVHGNFANFTGKYVLESLF